MFCSAGSDSWTLMLWGVGVGQLWVFCNREKRCVVLAWRGTEQLKWKDLLTDLRLAPTGFNVERVRGLGGGQDASSEVSTTSIECGQ